MVTATASDVFSAWYVHPGIWHGIIVLAIEQIDEM